MFTSYYFIGQSLRTLAGTTALQVRKNAGKKADDSFCAFSWVQTDSGVLDVVKYTPAPVNPLAFAPDLSAEYEVVPENVDMAAAEKDPIVIFFKKHYQQYVNIASKHNKMYVCLIFAGHDGEACAEAEFLAQCLDSITNANIVVDIMVLSPDLMRVTAETSEDTEATLARQNQATIAALKNLCAKKQEISVLHDVVLIQNTNAQRMALSMSGDTLAEVLAWRAIALTDNSRTSPVIRDVDDDVIATFGISCISFDRYYYLHYLLHHAYLSLMEREGVQLTQVDVNKVADVAQKSLKGREQVLTGFWNQNVAPLLNAGTKWDEIMPSIRHKMDDFIQELEKALTAFLPGDALSLPEKRAVIAQILLSDDDILAGSLFDTKQLTFLDVLKQPMAFFVDYNNSTTTFMKDEDGNTMIDPETNGPIVEHATLSRPRGNDGYVRLPIDEIKAMRIKIREASEYIRRMDDEIRDVRKQQNAAIVAQQVVVGGNFQFDDSRFKAVSRVFVEQPLTENYVAEKVTAEKNVDLSHDFPVVKDQSQVGACSAFAVTAVMEYILKKDKRLPSDLSERFVYYNVREMNDRLEENGAAVSEVINSMAKLGICPEKLCPYSTEHVNDRPSDEAYTEALKHRIIEAKNIPIALDIQHNIDQLKTAIAEGYPVIASFKVFKQMETGLPFISMPSDDEEGENHAMVICGFDDDTGFFKVRNSWGERFGDNGYCYMPYAYVGQKKYINAAYIITQIASVDHVNGIGAKHRISFDSADTAIKIAILSSLRDLKKVQQEQWMETYKTMYADLVHLNGNLKDKSKRDAIVDDAKELLKEKKYKQTERLSSIEQQMGVTIEEFRSSTRRTLISMIIPAAVLVGASFLVSSLTGSWGWLNTIMMIIAGIDVLAIVGFIMKRERALITLKNNLKINIDRQAALVAQTEEEMNILDKRAFVAGAFIDSLSNLHDNLGKLNVSIKSYVNNLSAWYDEERKSVDAMEVNANPPFISILENEALTKFFVDKEQTLTADIRLCELMKSGNYDIDEKSVIAFKNHLKETILKQLNRELLEFSIYNYWKTPQNYPFLIEETEFFTNKLSLAINSYSQVLLPQNNNQGDAGITIMIAHPSDKTAQLKSDFKQYCLNNPQCENITLSDALIVMQTQSVGIDNISL